MQVCTPSYIETHQSGFIKERVDSLYKMLESCSLCPHECKINRLEGEKGVCLADARVSVSGAFPHFGEEPPLVGRRGSGTIFFVNCNLRCVFCQNHDISHQANGSKVTRERLAELMLYLQGVGCLNINFVTPTHYAPQIIDSLSLAIEMGLNIPLVWNCSGYESLEVIKLLDGIIDIYMPDVKFGDSANEHLLSRATGYFDNVKKILSEMHRQVGDLELDEENIAVRGLLLRHLVMPNDCVGSKNILKFIAEEISSHTYINIMDQYRPAYKASKYSQVNRRITCEEYDSVINIAKEAGLSRGW